jgi:hypothetical protein
MTDDDTMALLARVRWLEAEVQRLIEHAAQAEADRDVFAAEVRAWRKAKYQCEDTWDAEERTDASGALTRAKEAK